MIDMFGCNWGEARNFGGSTQCDVWQKRNAASKALESAVCNVALATIDCMQCTSSTVIGCMQFTKDNKSL